ncbi:MAG TPA: ABC transporter permease [Terriglobales bacterium]|jgi:putative ABC transport system permease protein
MKRDLLQQAYGAMRHDMRKTILTILGMAWGIATVVLLLAYGQGFGNAIHNIFESYGDRAVGIFAGRTSQQAGGNKAGTPVRFTNKDVELLTNVVPLVKHVSRQSNLTATVQNGDRSFSLSVTGVDPAVETIWNLEVDDGRFLNDQDNSAHSHFAVLGSEAKDKLFSGESPLGQTIRVNGVTFEIIGVMHPRMQEPDDDDNRVVYIPFNSMDALQNNYYLGGIWLDFEGLDHAALTRTIRGALGAEHGFKPEDERAVFIFDAQKQLSQFSIISLGLKILLGFIGTITLAIGGIGLMNIMLVSVTQRTREIGVEKALGARKRDILFQFLAEAMVITGIGGVFGIILSYIVSFSVGRLTFYSALAKHAEAGDIRLIVAPEILIIAIVILAVVGICSGMFPALRAANLDPIEALRYE